MGKRFPFVYRLAVESLRQAHPEARVIVHYENPPEGNSDWEALRGKAELRPVDLAAWLSGLPPALQAVGRVLERVSTAYPAGRSNVLRLLALYHEGGVYLDFDTLTLQPFTPLFSHPAFIGEEEVFRCDDDRVAGRYTWDFPLMATLFGASYGLTQANSRWLGNNGAVNAVDRTLMRVWSARKLNNAVLGAEPGHPFFAEALELAAKADPGLRFALGPMLMNQTWDALPKPSIRRLGKNFFYSIPPSKTVRFFHGPAPALPDEAVALHWCSSNHRALAPQLTRAMLAESKSESLYYQLARAVLARGI
jgi:hypothetical protein